MAQGLNSVSLIGHLGADPELRQTSSGTAVLNMRLATTESWAGKSGDREEHTEWHTIVVWGKRAEGLAKFLSKGMQLYVQGALRTSSYEKDGIKRYKTEISATEVLTMGSRSAGGGRNRDSEQRSGGAPTRNDDGSYDDIPF